MGFIQVSLLTIIVFISLHNRYENFNHSTINIRLLINISSFKKAVSTKLKKITHALT